MAGTEKLSNDKSFGVVLGVALSKIFQRRFLGVLKTYCSGNVIDVGGWDYYLRVKDQVSFDHWVCLEYDGDNLLDLEDSRYECVQGDGCKMDFADNSFDTAVNNNVLEHVFEPVAMVNEIARVLKPGGHGLFVIPQTADIHMAPHHYHNFTRYWIVEVMKRANLEIIEMIPCGGVWRTIASRSALFFWHAFKADGSYIKGVKRPLMFYLLFPFMAAYALISTAICIILSMGDLIEEANNHVVVVRKPG